MDNYILEIPDPTDYTLEALRKIIDSPEFQSIIELYNSSDLETKRLGIELLKTFKDV
jgi:hypothetical protein